MRTPEQIAAEVMETLRGSGARPYLIPLGGSNGLGALGYVLAMDEALEQLAAERIKVDAMVFASSSGGTHAGLALSGALRGYDGQVLGVAIDSPAAELRAHVIEIALDAAKIADVAITSEELRIDANSGYLGGGYSVVGDLERDAIRTVARLEGLLLDPVYTGRAMGGLMDLIRHGVFTKNQNILFWHTGGAAALSAFAEKLCGVDARSAE
jgi:D-cysteine desulfhydrase